MQFVPAVATRFCRPTLGKEAVKLEMLRPPVQLSECARQEGTKELMHWRLTFQEQGRFALSINSESNEVVVFGSVFNSLHHKSTTVNIP